MKNSFHSDNFIFLINAASQVLTLSNIPSQSPSASLPHLTRKVHQKGCIDKVPTASDLYECLLKDGAVAEKCVLTGYASRKRRYCISYAST